MSVDYAALVRKLGEKGMSPAEIADVIEAMTGPVPAYGMEATTFNARQLRNKRYYESRKTSEARLKASEPSESKTPKTDSDEPKTDKTVSDAEPRTQVVYTTSSLRSEAYPPVSPNGLTAPTGAERPLAGPDPPIPKSKRGTRLPEDWEPTEADWAAARKHGLTDEEIPLAAIEFRNFWCSRSRDATRLKWPSVWENRCIELAQRRRGRGSRLAASPGESGGDRRGPVSFADLYARRHG